MNFKVPVLLKIVLGAGEAIEANVVRVLLFRTLLLLHVAEDLG